jgi:hypothetical protein
MRFSDCNLRIYGHLWVVAHSLRADMLAATGRVAMSTTSHPSDAIQRELRV